MNDDFDYLLWAYRAVFKQTDIGGGTVAVNITANERTVLLYGTLGANDYAAGRILAVRAQDEDDNVIAVIFFNNSVDNTVNSFPVSDHSAVTAEDGPEFQKRMVLGKGDYLRCVAASLAQNEELTIAIRALIRSWPPTVAIVGSSGTVTTTTTYDKVI